MRWQITPFHIRRLTTGLLLWVGLLTCLSLIGQIARYRFGFNYLKGFIPLFYVDLESNIPTWYSSFALLFAAALLAVITMDKIGKRDKYRRHWGALSLIFLLLSIDEISMIHEYLIDPVRLMLPYGGFFFTPG